MNSLTRELPSERRNTQRGSFAGSNRINLDQAKACPRNQHEQVILACRLSEQA